MRLKASWLCLLLLLGAPAWADEGGFDEAVHLIRDGAGEHRLLLLGEKHGTREIPDLVGALVRSYAMEGPVLLGLEVSRGEHAALRSYLDSDGDTQAGQALRAGPFWQADGDQHDGRRSLDMLDLIEDLRLLRANGYDVAILPFDVSPQSRVGSERRDRAMAQRVRAAYQALPSGRLLVLAGNVHAMLRKPEGAPGRMQTPMGRHLRDLDPYAINIAATTGHFWACTSDCKAVEAAPDLARGGPITRGFLKDVYDLQVVLPAFSVGRLIGATSANR